MYASIYNIPAPPLINQGALILWRELALTFFQTAELPPPSSTCSCVCVYHTSALSVCLHVCVYLVRAVNYLQIGLVNEACRCRDR